MKRIITGVLASIATLGLLAGCSSDSKSSATSDSSATSATTGRCPSQRDHLAAWRVHPRLPAGGSIPATVVDAMIAQFEAAGMKVDKACFTALLKDDSLRKLVEAGGTPSQDMIQKFLSCMGT